MKIRITKSEYDLISEITDEKRPLFVANPISKYELILSFENMEKAFDFDQLIKDKLVYQGFHMNYEPNKFGKMCESIIDKMVEILE